MTRTAAEFGRRGVGLGAFGVCGVGIGYSQPARVVVRLCGCVAVWLWI